MKIKSVKMIDSFEPVYDIEVDSTDHTFAIGTSIVHNCRLKSNIHDLGYFNSISGSALQVGSVKVSTINLARLALDTESEEEYLKELEHRVKINLSALHAVR